MRTGNVLKEIRGGAWYPELLDEDLQAVYMASKKNVIDSVTKFGRKDLTIRRQLLPIGPECEQGWWKLTPLGFERAIKEGPSWEPKYKTCRALILRGDEEV
jgi:hypothetical protein